MIGERMQYFPAPAKLNLFLHLVGRRPDGYHLLQTCYQFVDLCDQVGLRVRGDGRIERFAGADGVLPQADLAVRAARALQQASGCRLGADISVLKRIPMGAGLGGGSSDAATTLAALNRLWELGLDPQDLADLGLGLGADVPVFVHGRAAWAEGVGERLTPLYPPQAPAETMYLILKPNVSISTAAVFQDPDLTRNSPTITINGFLAHGGRNDCEAVVRRRYPQVAGAIDYLSRFGGARLTGTGACVFIDCKTSERGREMMQRMPPAFAAFLVRGLNDSPLLERLACGGASEAPSAEN